MSSFKKESTWWTFEGDTTFYMLNNMIKHNAALTMAQQQVFQK